VAILRHPLALKAVLIGIKHRCVEDSHHLGGEIEEKGPNSIEKMKGFLESHDRWVKEFDNRDI